MNGVTIDGVLYEVVEDSAQVLAKETGGGTVRRAFAGNSRSSIKWEKRGWAFNLYEMTPAQLATLMANTSGGQQVSCGTGADLMGVTLSCRVEVGATRYIHRGTIWTMATEVTIREV